MKISNIGGEFGLIKRVTRKVKDKGVVVGIGDDAAVIERDGETYLLATSDMLVEGDHFNLSWSTPKQIGMKAMEASVSDIAAMGGLPKYALTSLCLRRGTEVEFVDRIYGGMYSVCDKYGFELVGGDTTHGGMIVVDVMMLGVVEKERLCLRSDALVGDSIFVTGDLGKSTAGLELLKKKMGGHTKAHLEPKARLEEAQVISRHANAMIDVSDGLAPEVRHICEMSGVGARIYAEKIPVSLKTRAAAAKLGKNPIDFALYGGEDYELVFTMPKESIGRIKTGVPLTLVGEIVDKRKGRHLIEGEKKIKLSGGYDHFKK